MEKPYNLRLVRTIAIMFIIPATILFYVSCKDDATNMTDKFDCITMLDTAGLNLYQFNQYPPEQWKGMPYSEKIAQRQIPQDILTRMNNNALFMQFVNCDLAGDVLLYNSIQAGFRHSIESFNMLQELLSRNEIESFFLDKINIIDLSEINSNECHFFFLCLQMLSVQPEVINRINDSNKEEYIQSLLRQKEDIEQLAKNNPDWQIPWSLTSVFIGFGNFMIKYNYRPFIALIESDESVKGFMEGDPLSNEVALLIDIHFTSFYRTN